MSFKKITDLPVLAAMDGTEYQEVAKGGVSYRVDGPTMEAYLRGPLHPTATVENNTEFQACIELVSAGVYKIKDSITSIEFRPVTGGYSLPVAGVLRTNNCVSMIFDGSAYFNNTPSATDKSFYLEINTNYFRGEDIRFVGNGATTTCNLRYSFLINSGIYGVLLIKPSVENIKSTHASGYTVVSGTFSDSSSYENTILGADFDTLTVSGGVFTAFSGIAQVTNTCLEAITGIGYGITLFDSCRFVKNIYAEDISNDIGIQYWFKACRSVDGVRIEDSDLTNGGTNDRIYGFYDTDIVTNIYIHDVTIVSSNNQYFSVAYSSSGVRRMCNNIYLSKVTCTSTGRWLLFYNLYSVENFEFENGEVTTAHTSTSTSGASVFYLIRNVNNFRISNVNLNSGGANPLTIVGSAGTTSYNASNGTIENITVKGTFKVADNIHNVNNIILYGLVATATVNLFTTCFNVRGIETSTCSASVEFQGFVSCTNISDIYLGGITLTSTNQTVRMAKTCNNMANILLTGLSWSTGTAEIRLFEDCNVINNTRITALTIAPASSVNCSLLYNCDLIGNTYVHDISGFSSNVAQLYVFYDCKVINGFMAYNLTSLPTTNFIVYTNATSGVYIDTITAVVNKNIVICDQARATSSVTWGTVTVSGSGTFKVIVSSTYGAAIGGPGTAPTVGGSCDYMDTAGAVTNKNSIGAIFV